MSTHYMRAPEVEKIGRELIREHHKHLIDSRVEFIFCDTTPKKSRKEVWGTARKVTSLAAFLAGEDDGDGPGAFFAIVISQPIWKLLQPEQREALIDHELCHCWVEEKEDGTISLQILGHDLEEFTQIVLRHGLWRDDVQQFADVAAQAAQRSLYEDEDAPGPSVGNQVSRAIRESLEEQTSPA